MSADRPLEDWATLRRGGLASTSLEIPSIDTGIETGFGSVRLALGTDGELRLLLPIRQSERIARLPTSQSLRIGVSTYRLAGQPIRYLDLVCVTRALDGVFADVAEEMMQRISAGAAPTEACFSTLDDFRSLLTTIPQDATIQEIRGLAGELLMLNQLLRLDADAWRLWRGPLMERHDFRADRLAVEVKTTARTSSRSVTISAIDQLLPPDQGHLHLRLFQLEEASGAPISISALASEAAVLASDPFQVRSLLAAMGCPDADAPTWNRASFRLEGELNYLVDDAFPRIVPTSFAEGSLPKGVSGISYIVDLATAEASRTDDGAADAHLNGMIACLDR